MNNAQKSSLSQGRIFCYQATNHKHSLCFTSSNKRTCIFDAAMLEIAAWCGVRARAHAHAHALVVSDELRWPLLPSVELRHRGRRCSAPVTVCFCTLPAPLHPIMLLTFLTSWDQGTVWQGHMTKLLRHWLFIIAVSLCTVVGFLRHTNPNAFSYWLDVHDRMSLHVFHWW